MYTIVEAAEIRQGMPEYVDVLIEAEDEALALADQRWPGLSYGGFSPDQSQYGRTTLLPDYYADENGDILDDAHSPNTWGTDSWRQSFTALSPTAVSLPAWRTILQGGNANNIGITPEDVIQTIVGYAITDPTLLFGKIKHEIGDKIYPKIGIEDINGFEEPVIVFEEGYVLPPKTHFKLRGFQTIATGYQTFIPQGFMLYRIKDSVITE